MFASVREHLRLLRYVDTRGAAHMSVWGHPCINELGTGNPYANDPTADPQTASAKNQALQVHAPGAVPTETRRLHTRLHNNS